MQVKFVTLFLFSILTTNSIAAQCQPKNPVITPTVRPTIASIIRDLDGIDPPKMKPQQNSLITAKRFLSECNLSLSSAGQIPPNNNKSHLLQIVNSYLVHKLYATTSASNWLAFGQATASLKTYGMSYPKLEQVFSKATLLHCLQYDRPKLKTALKLLTTRLPPKLPSPAPNFDDIMFELALLNSASNAKNKEPNSALAEFDAAFKKLGKKPSIKHNIQYQIALGKYLISIESYEKALQALLNAYWLASEHNMEAQIAIANLALTNLYRSQGALDKALEHANQAANFYQHFESNLGFSETLVLLAEIYAQKHKYSFALTHYLNALEIEQIFQRDVSQAAINRFVAQTYLKLNRYPQALRHIDTAIDIASRHFLDNELTQALVLKGEIAVLMGKPKLAVNTLLRAFHDATLANKKELLLQGLPALSLGLEKLGHYQHALAVERHNNMLIHSENNKRQAQQAKAFQEKEQMVRNQMQLDELNNQQQKDHATIIELQKLNLFAFGMLAVLAIILLVRHRSARNIASQLTELKKELHSHPRSGLKNLRMLHERLAQSLAQTRANFEQWYLGDMIHEPFKDQLRFAMFEVPYLKIVYLQYGYARGLELERKMGNYINSIIKQPARLYHFSDAVFIYIEPNSNPNALPEELVMRIQRMADDFILNYTQDKMADKLRIGMTEFPFLPRAITSINDNQLIEILLLATSAARHLSKKEGGRQWVHLKAIDSAPAASFANQNLRQACLQGIANGLIRVTSSTKGKIDWTIFGEVKAPNQTRRPATSTSATLV